MVRIILIGVAFASCRVDFFGDTFGAFDLFAGQNDLDHLALFPFRAWIGPAAFMQINIGAGLRFLLFLFKYASITRRFAAFGRYRLANAAFVDTFGLAFDRIQIRITVIFAAIAALNFGPGAGPIVK